DALRALLSFPTRRSSDLERGGRRGRGRLASPSRGGGETAGEEADRSAFDIAFDPGDLASEAQPRHRLQAQPAIEQARAVDEGVRSEEHTSELQSQSNLVC